MTEQIKNIAKELEEPTKRAFAFDLGNGYVKATNGIRTIIAPSSIATESALGTSSFSGLTSKEDMQYEVFKSPLNDNETYIWGEGIAEAVEPEDLKSTYTDNERYNKLNFKLLCSFILGELASDFEESELYNVTLVTALPSDEIGSNDEKEYKEFLKKLHVVTRNDKQSIIEVVDVRIVEQPTGTLLDIYMKDNGLINKELLTSTITVIDFGSGTTIVDTFKNFNRLSDKSETYYVGMNDLHKDIAKKVGKQLNVKGLDPSYINNGLIRGDFIAKLSERKAYPFEEFIEEAVINFIDTRLNAIDKTLTNRDTIDSFIITGGGSHVVKDYFIKAFGEDKVKVADNSQLANLNGYYKFAKHLIEDEGKGVE